MASTPLRRDKITRAFAARVRKKIGPAKIILFGSRARGDYFLYSDYDFIIVSDVFKNVHWLKRISSVLKEWDSDKPIDVLPYATDEFEKKSINSSTVREAVREGIEV